MTDIFFLGPHHPIFETMIEYPLRGYHIIGDASDYLGVTHVVGVDVDSLLMATSSQDGRRIKIVARYILGG
jgi:hypothetical protein